MSTVNISKINSLEKKKTLLSALFLFVVFILFWRICETTSLIYIDDVMYANWTQHGLQYFFEQIKWHYNEFNGRTFIHVFLSLILLFKEHLYAILMPICVVASTFMIYDMVKPKSSVHEKMIASGVASLGFVGLSGYYLSTSLFWMAGGINYVFPLFVVLLSYTLFKRYLTNKKYLIPVIIVSFLAGCTTEQYGMYAIGLFLMSIVFEVVNKNHVNIKKYLIPFVSAIIGYCSILLSPGTQERASGIGDMGNFWSTFVSNNAFLCGNGSFIIIMFLLTMPFALMLYPINKRVCIIGVLTSCLYTMLCCCGLSGFAGLILILHFAIIALTIFKHKINNEIVKLMVCGYGTFFMINIATATGARMYIPFLLTYIILISCILLSNIFSKTNIKLCTIVLAVIVVFALFGNIGCISGAIATEVDFNNPIYIEISDITDNVVELDFDKFDRYNNLSFNRHSTPYDTSYGPDLKQYCDYFGHNDNTIYHHTSETYNVSDLTINGKYFITPIINKDGKVYVPYTSTSFFENATRAFFLGLDDIAKPGEFCSGTVIDSRNYFAFSSTGLLSMKDGFIIYLEKNADMMQYSLKSLDLTFIEISQFCKWADVTYTYDSINDVYHFISNS